MAELLGATTPGSNVPRCRQYVRNAGDSSPSKRNAGSSSGILLLLSRILDLLLGLVHSLAELTHRRDVVGVKSILVNVHPTGFAIGGFVCVS